MTRLSRARAFIALAGAPSLITLAAAALVRLAGLGRQAVVARVFGVSSELDVYLAALILPLFISNILGVAFTAVLVPHLIKVRNAEGREPEAQALRHTFKLASVTSGIAAIGLVALAPLTVAWVAPYLGSEPAATATARLAGPLVVVVVLSQVLTAACLVRRRFFIAAVAPISVPLSIATAAVLFESSPFGLMAGTLGGHLLVATSLGWSLGRDGAFQAGRTSVARKPLPSAEVVAMILSVAASGAAVTIDRALASRIGPGALSSLEFGTRISESFEGLMGVVIANVGSVGLAQVAIRHTRSRYSLNTNRLTLIVIAAVSLPVLLLMWWTPQLVDFLYGGGQFTADAANTVVEVQRGALARVPFYLAALFSARALNAINRSWTITRIMVVFALVSIAGDLILIPRLGVAGIAWATAFSYTVAAFTFMWSMRGSRQPEERRT